MRNHIVRLLFPCSLCVFDCFFPALGLHSGNIFTFLVGVSPCWKEIYLHFLCVYPPDGRKYIYISCVCIPLLEGDIFTFLVCVSPYWKEIYLHFLCVYPPAGRKYIYISCVCIPLLEPPAIEIGSNFSEAGY